MSCGGTALSQATGGYTLVLDQPSVEGSVRHLNHEDLEAYANGRLPAARLDDCSTHLDSCDACRAELEDLRLFQSEQATFPRAEPARRELGRRRRSGKLTLAQAASLGVIFVAAGSAVLWWRHESPRAKTTPAAVSVAQAPAAPRTLTASVAPTVLPAASTAQIPTVQLPAIQANTGFALLGPFGEAISETRPEFTWQPLAGAVRYSVVIVDAGLHPVQRSPALRTTAWRPRRPLRRGRTYLWQVTATLRGGSKVVASRPSPSEAALQIIPLKKVPHGDS
jgi:predicted anti-sigma-YlaC factor YlaD